MFPPNECPKTSAGSGRLLDDAGEIVELRLERVRVGVAAAASAAAIHRDDGETFGEQLFEQPEGRAVGSDPVHEHDRRPSADDAPR